MNPLQQIALQRLYNQQVIHSKFVQAADLVQWMGALQAQDYSMSKWAVATRLKPWASQASFTEDILEQAFEQGQILRTHILRPTWHLVAAQDIHWMLQLTAPNVKSLCKGRHQALGLDTDLLNKSKTLLERILSTTPRVSRTELRTHFTQAAIATDENRLTHLLMDAELDGIICNTGRIANQLAYSSLPGLIPTPKTLPREEALATLTHRYFTSHGPATVHDFAWWSGLSVTDCKTGLALNNTRLQSQTVENKTYWYNEETLVTEEPPQAMHLLPAFDESFISYTDRTAFIDKSLLSQVMTNNGLFYPLLMHKGQIVGTWKLQKAKITKVEALFFSEKMHLPDLIQESLQKYSRFLGKSLTLNTVVRQIFKNA